MDGKSIILRNNRTPQDTSHLDVNIRISLLSNSTSGIERGDDSSSINTSSYSDADYDEDKELNKIWIETAEEAGKGTLELKPLLVNGENTIKREEVQPNKDNNNIPNDKSAIPDGGWGWMIVLSSFTISVIADGISFSFGLLYIEFLEEFQASKAVTAWIGGLFIAVPLLSGPVMSALVDRYGCRSMTILGGLISSIGFVLASISTTLEMMMITFGVISGLGLGLVYVTAVVSIAFWFEKKRNLAVGLGACGTGVGTFLYAPLTQYLIEQYGWRGAILLLAGTLFNLCVCGCVMRDPDWCILEQEKQNKKEFQEKQCKKESNVNYDVIKLRLENMKKLIKDGSNPEKIINNEAQYIKKNQNVTSNKITAKRTRSLINIPLLGNKISEKEISDVNTRTPNKKKNEVKIVCNKSFDETDIYFKNTNDTEHGDDAVKIGNLKRASSDNFGFRKNQPVNYVEVEQLLNPKEFKLVKSEIKEVHMTYEHKRDWITKQLSIDHNYLRNLKMPINSISHRNAMLNIKKYKLKVSSCPDIFKNSMIISESDKKWYDSCVGCFLDLFNVSLFKEPTFVILCLSSIILFIWFIVPYFYLAEHMIHNGYSEDDGALMLSLIGVTNSIGMVGLGWVGDLPNVSIVNLYGFCMVICGITVFAIPLVIFNYWILASVSSAFGLFFAASFSLTPSLLVKLVSLDDFTTAYGLVLLADGIGHLIGPPLSGLIFDITLSWELSFYLAGGCIVIAGILISFIQPIKAYQEYRQEQSEIFVSSVA